MNQAARFQQSWKTQKYQGVLKLCQVTIFNILQYFMRLDQDGGLGHCPVELKKRSSTSN